MRYFILFSLIFSSSLIFAQNGWLINGSNVYTNSNVGINTDSPNVAFAVNDPYAVFGGTQRLLSGDGDTSFEVQSSTNVFFSVFGGVNGSNYSSFYFTCAPEFGYTGFTSTRHGSGAVLPITFGITGSGNDITKMRIATNGNVGIGIGDDEPQSKLVVNGTITTQEVVVTASGWPDFVFEKDYRLPSLEEIEAAIERDGHLPGIPSAAVVENGGLSVGDMQSKLLQKIEEITLHMIALKKDNDALKKDNNALKSRMTQLEANQ
jgi:hypothetical protein